MRNPNTLTISPREWARNSALYATYEVVREEKNAVILEKKPEYRKAAPTDAFRQPASKMEH